MTNEEVSGGLVMPYMAQAVAGKGGAVAILLILFMVRPRRFESGVAHLFCCAAILVTNRQTSTSVSSSQLIGVSSILTFDVYGTYINPRASNKQLIRATHIGVVGFAIVSSSFATGLRQGGVDLNFVLYMIGIIVWYCQLRFPAFSGLD